MLRTAGSLLLIVLATVLPAVAAQSEQTLLTNLAKTEKSFGASDTRTGEFLFAVGNYYHGKNDTAKEMPMYNRAMSIFEKSPGKNSEMLRFYTDQMARVYADEKQYDKAETLFDKSIILGNKLPGKDNTYVVPDSLLGLANVYIAESRYADAETALKKRVEMRHRFMNYGQIDPALLDLANLYTKWGKYDLAKQNFDELFKISPMPRDLKESYSAFVAKENAQNKAVVNN